MTDNEIIKALEICTSSSNGCSHNKYTCDDCYLKGQPMCSAVLHQDTIDLINRQQAEIEKLSNELKITRDYIHHHNLEYDLLSYSERNGG